MTPHWMRVKHLFNHLAYFIKDQDPSGIELYDTASCNVVKSKDTTTLLHRLSEIAPHLGSAPTDPSMCLDRILVQYRESLDEYHDNRRISWLGRPRPTTAPSLIVYIFTDGIWQPKCNMSNPIRTIIEKCIQYRLPRGKVGVQFIQFGDDAEGTEKLTKLDSKRRSGFKMCVRNFIAFIFLFPFCS